MQLIERFIYHNKYYTKLKICAFSDKTKNSCTKTQLLSLLISLLYVSKCLHPARFFLNRMLQVLRDKTEKSRFALIYSFHQHLIGLILFQVNIIVTYFDNKKVNFDVHLDASLTGFGPMVYAVPSPDHFTDFHITQLEMLNIVVALKVWANLW